MKKVTDEKMIARNQKIRIANIVKGLLESSKITEKQARKIIEDERFGLGVKGLIERTLAYPEEERSHNDDYLWGFSRKYEIKSIDEQVATLRDCFPELKGEAHIPEIPENYSNNGLFVFPWFFKDRDDLSKEILLRIFEGISKKINFKIIEPITEFRLSSIRTHRRYNYATHFMKEEQPGDFLVFPVQLGHTYQNISCRRVEALNFRTGNEFGLTIFEVGCMLLTHPEIYLEMEDTSLFLRIGCPGDVFVGNVDLSVPYIPCYDYYQIGTDGEKVLALSLVEASEKSVSLGFASGFSLFALPPEDNFK